MMTCSDCKREIGTQEESCIQDKTGRRLCVECADKYWDVIMCPPRGCSCSRGGNAITCECQGEREALDRQKVAALDADIREAESLVAFANDPTNARAILADLIRQRARYA